MAARAHATLAPSGLKRDFACPGNQALRATLPQRPQSTSYADWGTVAHNLAQMRILDRTLDLNAFIGQRDVTNDNAILIDEEMIITVQEYIDYIEDRVDNHGAEIIGVEVYFPISTKLGLPIDCGGTADCVLYYRHKKELEIDDLKTGAGVLVEAVKNDQERAYALGALLEYTPALKVDTVTTTIIQSRAEHDEGSIRSDSFSTIDLLDWVEELRDCATQVGAAMLTYQPDDPAWVERFVHIGEHCQFCDAMAICPAQKANSLALAEEWFVDEDRTTPEEIEADLERFDMVEEYIKNRRMLAHRMAEANPEAFHNWILVQKYGHRKFTETPGEIVDRITKAKPQATPDTIYEKKLKTPAALERAFGKPFVAAVLGDVIEKPNIGTDLVRRSAQSDKRTKVLSLTERFYQEIEQTEEEEKHGKG